MAEQTTKPIREYNVPPGPRLGPCSCNENGYRRHHDGVSLPYPAPSGCQSYVVMPAWHDWCGDKIAIRVDPGQGVGDNGCEQPAGFPAAPNDYGILNCNTKTTFVLNGFEEVPSGVIVVEFGWPTTKIPALGGGKHLVVLRSHDGGKVINNDDPPKHKIEAGLIGINSNTEIAWGGEIQNVDANGGVHGSTWSENALGLPVGVDATNRVVKNTSPYVWNRLELGWRVSGGWRSPDNVMNWYVKGTHLSDGTSIIGSGSYPMYGAPAPRLVTLGNMELNVGDSAWWGAVGIDRGRTFFRYLGFHGPLLLNWPSTPLPEEFPFTASTVGDVA